MQAGLQERPVPSAPPRSFANACSPRFRSGLARPSQARSTARSSSRRSASTATWQSNRRWPTTRPPRPETLGGRRPPRSVDEVPLPKLVPEPANGLLVLRLAPGVDLDERQEELVVRNARKHRLEARLVVAARAIEALPRVVGAVVELDRREDALVGGEALHEATGAHRVVVLAGARQPVEDAVLEGGVGERDRPERGGRGARLGA